VLRDKIKSVVYLPLDFKNLHMGECEEPDSAVILYTLLSERGSETNISHSKLPSWKDHIKFIKSRSYFKWWIIASRKLNSDGLREAVGTIYISHNNEIGVFIFKKHQRQGHASRAVRWLIRRHKPDKWGIRSGEFIANINPKNSKSIKMFEKLGFTHIQNTYGLKK